MTFAAAWAERLAEAGPQAGRRLHALFDLCWDRDLEHHPELATVVGDRRHNHRWTDMSGPAILERKREVGERLDALRGIDRAQLGDTDRVSYELFGRLHQLAQEGHRFPTELLAVTMMEGPHEWVPQVVAMMPAYSAGDYEDLAARLRNVPALFDQVVELLERGRAEGVTPPRVTLEAVPGALRTLASQDPENSPLLRSLRSFPETVAAAERDELVAAATAAYSDHAVPALRDLADFLEHTYLPACRTTIAARDLPDGEAWYAYDVRRMTTTDLDPAQIHEIGRAEVDRLRAAMGEAMAASGFSGDLTEFEELLRTDPQFFFDRPDALLAAYRDIAKRVDPELVRLFGTLPRLPYGVVPVPDHEAPSSPTAYYMPGSLRAGRPGLFFANTWDLASRPRWEMEALTLHEAVPGHHLQIALAAELEGLPKFRTLTHAYTAYVEGWGLYSESLGGELGFYTDPYARFGQLTYEMWRAIRLVVDTGIHAFGWTREQAVDLFRSMTGKTDHDIAVEVDRYISWPAQALAYKIGELKIKELRALATSQLGPQFDVRAFHDVVLGAGALPLDVLEARVHEWLAVVSPAELR